MSRSSWKLGQVAGIDLYLHPTFLLLLLFVGLTQGGLIAVALVSAVFGCVLLHELGHALTARLYGIPTEDITLYPIGGVARLARMPRKAGPELLVTLAGPAVNLLIAASLAVLLALVEPFWPASLDRLPLAFVSTLMGINLTLALFNLVPAFPMDGGRVLRALLSSSLGRLRATEIAVGLGKVLALSFGVWSLLQGQFLHTALAVFLHMAGQAELSRVRAEERGEADDVTPPDDRSPFGGGRRSPGRWIPVAQGLWRLQPIPVSNGWERRRR